MESDIRTQANHPLPHRASERTSPASAGCVIEQFFVSPVFSGLFSVAAVGQSLPSHQHLHTIVIEIDAPHQDRCTARLAILLANTPAPNEARIAFRPIVRPTFPLGCSDPYFLGIRARALYHRAESPLIQNFLIAIEEMYGEPPSVSGRLLAYAAQLVSQGIPSVHACEVSMMNPISDDVELQRSIKEIITTVIERTAVAIHS